MSRYFNHHSSNRNWHWAQCCIVCGTCVGIRNANKSLKFVCCLHIKPIEIQSFFLLSTNRLIFADSSSYALLFFHTSIPMQCVYYIWRIIIYLEIVYRRTNKTHIESHKYLCSITKRFSIDEYGWIFILFMNKCVRKASSKHQAAHRLFHSATMIFFEFICWFVFFCYILVHQFHFDADFGKQYLCAYKLFIRLLYYKWLFC